MHVYVCVCVYICIYKYADSYKFIQDPDPDPGLDPELSEKSDPDPGSDPKKIIPDPQHCPAGPHTDVQDTFRGEDGHFPAFLVALGDLPLDHRSAVDRRCLSAGLATEGHISLDTSAAG